MLDENLVPKVCLCQFLKLVHYEREFKSMHDLLDPLQLSDSSLFSATRSDSAPYELPNKGINSLLFHYDYDPSSLNPLPFFILISSCRKQLRSEQHLSAWVSALGADYWSII